MKYLIEYYYIKSDHILASPEYDHEEIIEVNSKEKLENYIKNKKNLTMETLKLTEEHKKKLLEMSKKLFPEYILIGWLNGEDNLELFFSKDSKSSTSIHWFEFCMLHIFPKVQQIYNTEQLATFYYETYGYYQKSNENKDWNHPRFTHPIDFLYKEFQKFK